MSGMDIKMEKQEKYSSSLVFFAHSKYINTEANNSIPCVFIYMEDNTAKESRKTAKTGACILFKLYCKIISTRKIINKYGISDMTSPLKMTDRALKHTNPVRTRRASGSRRSLMKKNTKNGMASMKISDGIRNAVSLSGKSFAKGARIRG
ncbi:MAG: hypothetical protein ABIH89_03075 [Elusimicrobiota bacterium]